MFRKFFNLLKLDKKEISYLYLFAIVTSIISFSLPLGIQGVIGIVSVGQITTSWYVLLILLIAGIAGVSLLQILQIQIVEILQQRLFVRVAFDFADRALKIKHNSNRYLPEEIIKFLEVTNIQKSLSKILLDLSAALLQILLGVILVSLYHSLFAIVGILLIVITVVILSLSGKSGLETSIIESKYKYKVMNWLLELGNLSQALKFYKDNDFHFIKTDKYVQNYIEYRNKHFKILKSQFVSLLFLKVVFTLLLFVVGGILVVNGSISIGEFVGSELVIVLIIHAIEKIVLSTEVVYDVLTAVDKIDGVMNLELDSEENTNITLTTPLTIVLQKIIVEINHKVVLNNISLNLYPNQKIMLCGSGNSGKSTLSKTIAGLQNFQEGSILYNNVPQVNLSKQDIYKQIALIESKSDVFKGTILENILIGAPMDISKLNVLAKDLGILDLIQEFDEGWHHIVLPNGINITESLAFKILIMRALFHHPETLIIDADIDFLPQSDMLEIWNTLKKNYQGTLLLVSSNRTLAKDFDNIIVLDKGNIVFNDSYQALIQTKYITFFNL